MIPAPFDYVAPTSLDEAIGLLQEHGDEAKLLAGGHSLLPLMKLRLAVPAVVVDLRSIPDLSYVRDMGGSIAVGAMTRYVDLQRSELLHQRVPMLPEAVADVGDAQVRNRGTIGGALAHADPAGDMPTVMAALGGSVIARGPQGDREISLDEFFVDIFTSALAPNEVLTEIRIDARPGRVQRYEKFRRRAADWATVGAAVSVTVSGATIVDARVRLANVGPRPMRAESVESALQGREVTVDVVRSASDRAADGLEPSEDLNAPPEYKLHLARVLTRRALERAMGMK